MNKTAILVGSSLLALAVALPVAAQTTITGIRDLSDRIDDVQRDAQRGLNRQDDIARFGENAVVQGIRGQAALTASGSSGNTDEGKLEFAGRLTYGVGAWNNLFGFAGEYGESNGDKDTQRFFGIYEGSRALSPTVYAYGVGRYQYDGFASNEHDAFLGIGLGYRIVNTDEIAWRVQAGPGVRYIEDQNDNDQTDIAGLASSRFYYGLTDVVSLTNDTDILFSDSDYVLTNDFGVNFRMNDTFSTRLNYRTDYESDPLPGFDNTDNIIGISLVVGF